MPPAYLNEESIRQTLLILEAAIVELQAPAVLGDHAHDLVRCAIRDVCLDL